MNTGNVPKKLKSNVDATLQMDIMEHATGTHVVCF
jgi:hypothetical protein